LEEALKNKDMDRYGAQYITLESLREYHVTTCK